MDQLGPVAVEQVMADRREVWFGATHEGWRSGLRGMYNLTCQPPLARYEYCCPVSYLFLVSDLWSSGLSSVLYSFLVGSGYNCTVC